MEICLPINPKEIPSAQQKEVSSRYGRTFIFQNKRAKAMRKRLGELVKLIAGETLEAPAYVFAVEYIYLRKKLKRSLYGKPRTESPDLDNITKLLQDAITDSKVAWSDDRLVSTTVQRKRWANPDKGEVPCVRIRIEEDLCELT